MATDFLCPGRLPLQLNSQLLFAWGGKAAILGQELNSKHLAFKPYKQVQREVSISSQQDRDNSTCTHKRDTLMGCIPNLWIALLFHSPEQKLTINVS